MLLHFLLLSQYFLDQLLPQVQLNLPSIFFGQYIIKGCTMGAPDDYKNMLAFISDNNLKPKISKEYDFESAKNAFLEMKNNNQFGKIIINI